MEFGVVKELVEVSEIWFEGGLRNLLAVTRYWGVSFNGYMPNSQSIAQPPSSTLPRFQRKRQNTCAQGGVHVPFSWPPKLYETLVLGTPLETHSPMNKQWRRKWYSDLMSSDHQIWQLRICAPAVALTTSTPNKIVEGRGAMSKPLVHLLLKTPMIQYMLGSFENSYIPENPRTPPISYISQTVIPFKKPTSEPSKTFRMNKIR
ncbi:hypothetical protein LXL04_037850 [Taraxacum kok-saghyz]